MESRDFLAYLYRLMAGLLTIPVSNLDSKCGFSMLRKIHIDLCPSLKPETVFSITSVKFNNEECNPELLSKCEKSTV